jgi:hypothetical protein
MAVEIPEQEVNQELVELLDALRDNDQVLRVDRAEKPQLYITYLYPRRYSDDADHVYYVISKNHIGGKFASKMAIHDSLMDMPGSTVECIDVDEMEDCRNSVEDYMNRSHPFDEVHVFVKTVDDGRYKDDSVKTMTTFISGRLPRSVIWMAMSTSSISNRVAEVYLWILSGWRTVIRRIL